MKIDKILDISYASNISLYFEARKWHLPVSLTVFSVFNFLCCIKKYL